MKIKIFILVIGIVFLVNLVYALDDANVTEVYNTAVSCLVDSKNIMNELNESGFNIYRVNASLQDAEEMFEIQEVLKQKKRNYDFTKIISYCDEIKKIQESAFESRDEFSALLIFYKDTLNEHMNTISADVIIRDIEDEIESERYEKAIEKIPLAYEEISKIQSDYTTLNLFYRSTTRSLKRFFAENWVLISAILSVLLVLFFIYKTAIHKYIINVKLKNLELRKDNLKKLIQRTQRDYFQFGKIPEGIYNIRTKKFAELIRDIDRQIPLLREDLMKLKKNVRNIKK